MADPAQKRLAIIACFLCTIYLTDMIINPPTRHSKKTINKQSDQNFTIATEENNDFNHNIQKRDYIGTWLSESKTFDEFSAHKGRAAFKAFKDASNITINRFFVYDGL